MIFLLDNPEGNIVNLPEVYLHPYQDPFSKKKGGGAGRGIVSLLSRAITFGE